MDKDISSSVRGVLLRGCADGFRVTKDGKQPDHSKSCISLLRAVHTLLVYLHIDAYRDAMVVLNPQALT